MRKKKWVEPFINEENKYIIKENNLKGQWLNKYSKNKLFLEIGMGMGDFITGSALLNQDILYVGFEKVMTCVAKAAIKADDAKLDNFKVILDTAENLEEYFTKEVDRIYLHFSDPWPKKAHSKRRLTHNHFLDIYSKVLKDDGDLIFKTDNKDLFEFSIKEFLDYKWQLLEFSVDYHRKENNDIKTGYEEKFSNLGQPIYYAKFQKN